MTALWLTFQSLDSNSERKVVFVSHESFLYLYLSSISNKQTTILDSKSRERKQISIKQTQESLDRWWFTLVVSLDTSRGEFFFRTRSNLTLWSKTNRSLSTLVKAYDEWFLFAFLASVSSKFWPQLPFILWITCVFRFWNLTMSFLKNYFRISWYSVLNYLRIS